MAESAEARERLRLARAAVAWGGDMEHQPVHPLLLTRYAEEPDALEPATRRHIEALLADSPLAREALACLERTLEAEGRTASSTGRLVRWFEGLWATLRGSVLRPLPALAYLLLACALLPIWRRETPAPLTVPPVVVAAGSDVRRGAGGAPDGRLLLDGEGPVLIELHTGLLAEDLAGATGWSLALEQDDTTLWSVEIDRARFEMSPGGAVLRVMIDLAALEPGKPYSAVLRVHRPGDLLDGHALFRQDLERR
ncbi:MAG: hypothetical protein Q9Q13_13830 [Acidobacteriota bacterium]|nr:hypothetical protein [Acidobacteriota bacterium]